MNDIDAMAKELSDDFDTVLPMASTSSNVNSATKCLQGSIYGTKPSYFEVMNLNVVFAMVDWHGGLGPGLFSPWSPSAIVEGMCTRVGKRYALLRGFTACRTFCGTVART